MLLAELAGLHALLGERLTVNTPHPVAKAASVVAGMLAGADSIDDLDVLRHGGMPRLFAGVRAPSTLGTYLRLFTHGHVQQLDERGQGELFDAYRHHAFITNSTLPVVEADSRHRDHAVIEQVIAELKEGPLAHLPSGSYTANAAWLAHAVIAFNLARAAGVLADCRHARARWATVRRHLINVPARIASSARRLTLHLPRDWPWATAWQTLFDNTTGPPLPTTS